MMKRMLIVFALVAAPAALFGQETGKETGPFALEVGGSLTLGIISGEEGEPWSGEEGDRESEENGDLEGLQAALFGLRVGPLVDLTYRLSDMIRIGAETGALFMAMSLKDQPHAFVDLPIRGIVRFQSGPIFLQPHVGAYIGLTGLEGLWLDLGTKLGFGGKMLKFFLEGEYLLSFSPDTISYPRFGLGVLYDFLNF